MWKSEDVTLQTSDECLPPNQSQKTQDTPDRSAEQVQQNLPAQLVFNQPFAVN